MSKHTDVWSQMLEDTHQASDIDEREAKIARISSDPRPEYAAPVKRDYPTTELHNIICVDAENANLSMPEAEEKYNSPHKVGGVLASDRLDVPLGWIKPPARGTSIETIKETYPSLYEALKEKKVEKF
jgi:hypothetical protein